MKKILFLLLGLVVGISASTVLAQVSSIKDFKTPESERAVYFIQTPLSDYYVSGYSFVSDSCILTNSERLICGSFEITPFSKYGSPDLISLILPIKEVKIE